MTLTCWPSSCCSLYLCAWCHRDSVTYLPLLLLVSRMYMSVMAVSSPPHSRVEVLSRHHLQLSAFTSHSSTMPFLPFFLLFFSELFLTFLFSFLPHSIALSLSVLLSLHSPYLFPLLSSPPHFLSFLSISSNPSNPLSLSFHVMTRVRPRRLVRYDGELHLRLSLWPTRVSRTAVWRFQLEHTSRTECTGIDGWCDWWNRQWCSGVVYLWERIQPRDPALYLGLFTYPPTTTPSIK